MLQITLPGFGTKNGRKLVFTLFIHSIIPLNSVLSCQICPLQPVIRRSPANAFLINGEQLLIALGFKCPLERQSIQNFPFLSGCIHICVYNFGLNIY